MCTGFKVIGLRCCTRQSRAGSGRPPPEGLLGWIPRGIFVWRDRSHVTPPQFFCHPAGRCRCAPLSTSKRSTHGTQLPPYCRHSHHSAIVGAGSLATINSSVFFTPFEDRVERLLIVDIPLVLVPLSQYGLPKLIPRNFCRQPKIPPQISLELALRPATILPCFLRPYRTSLAAF